MPIITASDVIRPQVECRLVSTCYVLTSRPKRAKSAWFNVPTAITKLSSTATYSRRYNLEAYIDFNTILSNARPAFKWRTFEAARITSLEIWFHVCGIVEEAPQYCMNHSKIPQNSFVEIWMRCSVTLPRLPPTRARKSVISEIRAGQHARWQTVGFPKPKSLAISFRTNEILCPEPNDTGEHTTPPNHIRRALDQNWSRHSRCY